MECRRTDVDVYLIQYIITASVKVFPANEISASEISAEIL